MKFTLAWCKRVWHPQNANMQGIIRRIALQLELRRAAPALPRRSIPTFQQGIVRKIEAWLTSFQDIWYHQKTTNARNYNTNHTAPWAEEGIGSTFDKVKIMILARICKQNGSLYWHCWKKLGGVKTLVQKQKPHFLKYRIQFPKSSQICLFL